jgi:DNA-binding LytR/AlgR family response regulator
LQLNFEFVEGNQSIDIADLYYIESCKHKVIFYVQKEKNKQLYTLYAKLDDLEHQLEQYLFIRIHKSYLVNYRHIHSVRNYILKLDTGEVLNIPKERFQAVKERYYELRGGMR